MLRTVLFFINLKKSLLRGNGRRLICSYPAVVVTFGATGSAVNLVNHLCPVNAAPHRADVRHKKAKQPTGKVTACCRCLSAGGHASAVFSDPPTTVPRPVHPVCFLPAGREDELKYKWTDWQSCAGNGRKRKLTG